MDTTRIAEILERVEEELERVKVLRPVLKSRCERAEALLVTQISVANGHRPIRVRLHADGSHTYVVRSGAKLKRTYTVEPEHYKCSCPDAKKRQAACKHGIAAYVLGRAMRPSHDYAPRGQVARSARETVAA